MQDLKTQNKMSDHQRILLMMLKDFDRVCKKNHIPYMLFSGTALGAVRHHGFIPWDDDIDVIMLRKNYNRFFEIADRDFDTNTYYIQQEYSEHWPMQFSKLRMNHTTCMEKCHPKDLKMHQGVYIDIFPCDNLSENELVRRMQFAASKVVIAKALYARGYETNSLAKKCFMQLCCFLPQKPFWRFCVREKAQESDMVHSFLGGGSKYKKNIFPRKWFEETIDMQFEDGVFRVSAYYDALLSRLYGDYRRIPKPEERTCKEHVGILDLEHSYTEHLDEQKAMKIDTLTRSIR